MYQSVTLKLEKTYKKAGRVSFSIVCPLRFVAPQLSPDDSRETNCCCARTQNCVRQNVFRVAKLYSQHVTKFEKFYFGILSKVRLHAVMRLVIQFNYKD